MSRVTQGNNGITQCYSTKHRGVDIGWHRLESDNKVLAHSDGVVTWVQTGQKKDLKAKGNKKYGNAIKIKHANGMYTLYAHLRSVKVKKGGKVKKAQVIGIIGSTGVAYGRHLHFEVRDKNNVRINPTLFINADLPNNPTGKRYILLFKKCFRKEPKVANNVIKKIPSGTVIQAIDDKIETSKTGSKWVHTELSGVKGYICIEDKSGKQAKEI